MKPARVTERRSDNQIMAVTDDIIGSATMEERTKKNEWGVDADRNEGY